MSAADLLLGFTDQPWRDQAACRGLDPELFFPSSGQRIAEPLAVCRTCPVRTDCLEYALEHERNGIWGGMAERERDYTRRRRRMGLETAS